MWTQAALLVVCAWLADAANEPAVLRTAYSTRDPGLDTDPAGETWRNAPRVTAGRDYLGEPIAGRPTEIRSRWTKDHLYLLYICPYDALNLKPDADRSGETQRLWNWDVAEAFIGSDLERPGRYKEFQVSPQGEWVDLEIDREDPKAQGGSAWNSGFTVAARIDSEARVWYGMMRIPFAAVDTRAPEKGRVLRAGLYRIAGVAPNRQYYAWRPTGQKNFHVPQAFGTIRLE